MGYVQKMSIDFGNKIVFRRPCQLRYHFVSSIDGVALVDHVQILATTLVI